MKKAIIFLLAVLCAYIVVYCAVRSAINDEIKEAVSSTIREEFEYDRQNFKLIIE